MTSAITADQFDYIIVGGGSAGCVVASRLSEDATCRVLLLEAGPPPRSPWIGIPAGLPRLLGSRYNWGDLSEPEAGLDNRRLPQFHGRTLGGSGAINGMVYNRGHPDDFDGWRDLGNAGWGWADVEPWFERVEATVETSLPTLDHPVIDAFLAAAQSVGLDAGCGFAQSMETGVGRFRLTIARGRRNSPYDAYIRPVRRRPNLRIVTGAAVQRILIRDGRASGVEWERGGVTQCSGAAGEVILCAGAIDSPRLLMLSGIGDPEALRGNGIAPIASVPGVGCNLIDHPFFGITADTRPAMSLNPSITPARQPLIGLEWLLARRGLATVGGSLAGAFAACLPGSRRPDVQINFRPFSTRLTVRGSIAVARQPQVNATVALLLPRSRGAVRLRGPSPDARPSIAPAYLSDPADMAGMAAGVRLLARVLRAPPLGPHITSPALPGDSGQDEDALMEQIRQQLQSMAHPVGTCRMGRDPMAVVDERLKVRGVDGLRVVDCSIMPTITAGNTNAPAMMIGEKAAAMILQDRAH